MKTNITRWFHDWCNSVMPFISKQFSLWFWIFEKSCTFTFEFNMFVNINKCSINWVSIWFTLWCVHEQITFKNNYKQRIDNWKEWHWIGPETSSERWFNIFTLYWWQKYCAKFMCFSALSSNNFFLSFTCNQVEHFVFSI